MKIRSFLAFELPAQIETVVRRLSEEMRSSPVEARWVKPENIHLTVVFLGNIEPDQLTPIGNAVGPVCETVASFRIALNGVGFFGSRRHPRVLWAGLSGDIDRMSRFRNDLFRVLKPWGIKVESRPFRPHLTLARFPRGRSVVRLDEVIKPHREVSSEEGSLTELALFKSDLKPGGAQYTKLDAWRLSGGP